MWADVLDLVRDWDDDEYDYEPITDEITLKSTAWERVAAMSEALSIPVPQLLNLADGALWAMQAVEGKQYEIEDGHVLRIDAVTGQHVSISDGRTRALEFRVLREAPSLTVPVAAIDSIGTAPAAPPRDGYVRNGAAGGCVLPLHHAGLHRGGAPSVPPRADDPSDHDVQLARAHAGVPRAADP